MRFSNKEISYIYDVRDIISEYLGRDVVIKKDFSCYDGKYDLGVVEFEVKNNTPTFSPLVEWLRAVNKVNESRYSVAETR